MFDESDRVPGADEMVARRTSDQQLSDVALRTLLDRLDHVERKIAEARPRRHTALGLSAVSLTMSAAALVDAVGWGYIALLLVLFVVAAATPYTMLMSYKRQRTRLLAALGPAAGE